MSLEKEDVLGEFSVGKRKEHGERYNRGAEIIKLIVIFLTIVGVCIFIYYFGFHSKECNDEGCFLQSLVKCQRAHWLSDKTEAAWNYEILGQSSSGKCQVDVTLLQAKKGKVDLIAMQGKSMMCEIPIGTIVSPEKNLEQCSGELKEDLQDLIIKRMHSYILENLQGINSNLANLTDNLTSVF